MTKYILHGGATRKKTDDNKKFFAEMCKNKSNEINILCVYFTQEKNAWDKLFTQEKNAFQETTPTKNLNFTLAKDDIKIFKEQIKQNDVIYMRGGKTEMLMNVLNRVENFKDLIKNKIISGSSAGACVLSKYYASNKIEEGLGILPIKTIVHYSEKKPIC